jgi:hypothetical protein
MPVELKFGKPGKVYILPQEISDFMNFFRFYFKVLIILSFFSKCVMVLIFWGDLKRV